jgi:hypothetical protein
MSLPYQRISPAAFGFARKRSWTKGASPTRTLVPALTIFIALASTPRLVAQSLALRPLPAFEHMA